MAGVISGASLNPMSSTKAVVLMADDSSAATGKSETGPVSFTQKQLHLALEAMWQTMPGLARSPGADGELIPPDYRDVSSSLVAAEGSVTGQAWGPPLTDLILRILRESHAPSDLINCQTQTSDGRLLRSSIFFTRDGHDSVLDRLCIGWKGDRRPSSRVIPG
jgi:predicted transcriptional regulator YheO